MTVDSDTISRHAFTQAMMARGCVKEDEVKQIYRSLSHTSSAGKNYNSFVAEINQQLEFVHFEIRTMTNMFDGTKWVGLVNKVMDSASKSLVAWPSAYTHIQLLFFKALIDRLATEETPESPGKPFISSTEAVNLGLCSSLSQPGSSNTQATVKRMSIQEKQDALNSLAADHWLDHHPEHSGHFCIGIRTFLELRTYLLSLDLPDSTRQAWEACM
mmetsp:Transcript_9636/g.27573  ORF Transcript_9636/g.27573 Transcript_9636/m.27573 type:complete len:215 (-) Transcript_9636:125-769(-)